jgi:hypothetical protein
VLTVVIAGTPDGARRWAGPHSANEALSVQPSDWITGANDDPPAVTEITCNRVR